MKKKTEIIGKIGGIQSQLHQPDPVHVQAVLKGGRIHKSAKTYTRKAKHKEDYTKEEGR